MARKPTYIRAWREAGGAVRKPGGYTLDELAGRLEVLGVKTTAASLSRIERGIQPYSQDILEAIADALGVTVEQLTGHDPNKAGEAVVIDFVSRLGEEELRRAEAVLRAMFGEQAAQK